MQNVVLLAASTLVLAACAAPTPYLARGQVGLDRVSTSVDSALAAYYVTDYLQGRGGDALRKRQLDQLLAFYDSRPLATAELSRLAHSTSNDFAAVYFAERVTREQRELKERFLAYAATRSATRLDAPSYVVVFVPGLFYKTHPETKGDLRDAEQLVRSMGVATDRVESGDADTVEGNARCIADFIARRNDGRQLILVSASKGGPEVLYALGKLLSKEHAQRVRAWVSIGGVLRGSPVADRYLKGPRSWLAGVVAWWMGFPREMVASLSTQRSLGRFAESFIPKHVLILHYVAVPLSGTVTKEVRDPYDVMQPHGPSDGLTVLTDELLDGGKIITDVGLDHRYADPRIGAKTAALTRIVLELTANPH